MPVTLSNLNAAEPASQPPPATVGAAAAAGPSEGVIRGHILAHYRSLYRGEKRCRVPILQGRQLAAALGFPAAVTERIADQLWLDFVPCGNPLPLLAAPAAAGSGLNLGCGAGIDATALSLLGSATHPIVNLDPVAAILHRAARLPPNQTAPARRIRWCAGEGEALPFKDGSFHWVLMNGVFNLFPSKPPVLREVNRVLAAGGRLVICDLFHDGPLPDDVRRELDAWAWCLGGAVDRNEVGAILAQAGFQLERFELEETIDRFCRAGLRAQKP